MFYSLGESFWEQEDREKTFQLFEASALEVVPMPDDESKSVFSASAQALINKIKTLSGVMVLRRRQILPPMVMKPHDALGDDFPQTVQGIVLIGASTGGPQALKEILVHLPAEFPLPIVCVQHMRQGFIDWLAVDCALLL